MKKVLIGLLFCLCMLPMFSAAEDMTEVTTEHVYVMGDNDSRSQGRRICLMEAKRKLVEQLGTHVEVLTDMSDFKLSSDEVHTFAAATMRVDVVEEAYFMQGESFAIRMKVKALVNKEKIRRELADAVKRRENLKRMTQGYQQARDLENRVISLQKQINAAPPAGVESLRQQQGRILQKIEDVEAEYAAIIESRDRQQAYAAEFLEKGMTMDEVRRLAGPPRAVHESGGGYSCWNYGEVWVVFRDGLVACKRRGLQHGRACDCKGFVGVGDVFE